MTLIEAPRSSMASVKVQSLMVQETLKVSGSLHFNGKVDGGMAMTKVIKLAILGRLVRLRKLDSYNRIVNS